MNEASYNYHHFAEYLDDFFAYTPCFLCGNIHKPEIHQIVDRNISPDNSKKIKVIRFICQPNLETRKETGERLQYTITLLPGFLVPHSRVPVENIYKALDIYLSNEDTIQQEAALIINCQSRHSFRLYYKRFCNLVEKWITFLYKVLPEITKDEIPVKFGRIWKQLKEMLISYESKIRESSAPISLSRGFKRLHIILFYRNMGLGP